MARASPPKSSVNAASVPSTRGCAKPIAATAPCHFSRPGPSKTPKTFCAPWAASTRPLETRITVSARSLPSSDMRQSPPAWKDARRVPRPVLFGRDAEGAPERAQEVSAGEPVAQIVVANTDLDVQVRTGLRAAVTDV